MILYPTETLYALGVNALDVFAVQELFALKGREMQRSVSWLVRNIEDIQRYAYMSEKAIRIVEEFLPGPITLVLPVKDIVPKECAAEDSTLGFRISSDAVAQRVIGNFMAEHDVPLTCTSANISGSPTFSTPEEIRQQFGPKANLITEIIDDGPRKGLASTVVRVVGDEVTILREGQWSEADIQKALR